MENSRLNHFENFNETLSQNFEVVAHQILQYVG